MAATRITVPTGDWVQLTNGETSPNEGTAYFELGVRSRAGLRPIW